MGRAVVKAVNSGPHVCGFVFSGSDHGGETGTGKEPVAQSIRNRSRRFSRPNAAVNCAAIPENLLKGILFGSSKGAFTGANDRPGLLERTSGETLFMDELNSMSGGILHLETGGKGAGGDHRLF